MNPTPDTREQAPRQKTKFRVWLEIAIAIGTLLTMFAGASIWLFQNVSDKAVQRALMPMKLERLEKTTGEHETRLAEVEKRQQIGEMDRAAIRREHAESRAAFSAQIRDLATLLEKRLDRIDDKAERIGERVGVPRKEGF